MFCYLPRQCEPWMLTVDNPPPTTMYPKQAQHLVITIEALCEYLANYIYSFEELKFDHDQFFGSVIKLISEGDPVDTALALAEAKTELYEQSCSFELDEVNTYVHLLETAIESISQQLDLLGLRAQETSNLQYFGFKHQRLFLAKTIDYDYE